MRLPAALYCLAIRLPCTSQLERAIGPRPCAWACDITDNYRLTSVAQLPSSSRRWRRCTSTDCAGALLAIFWCAHTLRPCTRTLRLKCINRPALCFTTGPPQCLLTCSARPACADGCTDADPPRLPALKLSPRPRSPASSPPCSRSTCSTLSPRCRCPDAEPPPRAAVLPPRRAIAATPSNRRTAGRRTAAPPSRRRAAAAPSRRRCSEPPPCQPRAAEPPRRRAAATPSRCRAAAPPQHQAAVDATPPPHRAAASPSRRCAAVGGSRRRVARAGLRTWRQRPAHASTGDTAMPLKYPQVARASMPRAACDGARAQILRQHELLHELIRANVR